MKHTVTPKNDIVLSNGVFLRRGRTVEVEISDRDYTFIKPFVQEIITKDKEIKPKKGRKKNELD